MATEPKRRFDGSISRISGRRLQRIREAHFRLYPLCVRCEAAGRTRAATQLDHIIALINGGLDFDRDGGRNRQGLCEQCHEDKTREDLGYKPARRIGLDGFPIKPEETT